MGQGRRRKRNSVTYSRCRYTDNPERNLFLHVLKLWIIDIKKNKGGASKNDSDCDDFIRLVDMAELNEELVAKLLNYMRDNPYKPRQFDMFFNRLVRINYTEDDHGYGK